MDDNRLRQYISGNLSQEEREAVVSWIEESEENLARYASLKADDAFGSMPYTISSKSPAGKKRPTFTAILGKVAAAALIPLAVLSGYLYNSRESVRKDLNTMIEQTALLTTDGKTMMEYSVAPGVKGQVTLPDGSKVWLNSASKLTCPLVFDAKERVLSLSGEGYFDVVKNPDWPMLVKTPLGITAKVLGTKFNLSAYEDDDNVKFTLVSGNVILVDEKTGNEHKALPTHEVAVSRSKQTEGEAQGKVQKVDVFKNTAWKEGILLFEDTPMSEVIKRLERWYGVEIVLLDKLILNNLFTASFDSESINQVLEMIKISSLVDYSIEDRKVTIWSAR